MHGTMMSTILPRADIQQVDPSEVPFVASEIGTELYMTFSLLALLLYDTCETCPS